MIKSENPKEMILDLGFFTARSSNDEKNNLEISFENFSISLTKKREIIKKILQQPEQSFIIQNIRRTLIKFIIVIINNITKIGMSDNILKKDPTFYNNYKGYAYGNTTFKEILNHPWLSNNNIYTEKNMKKKA